MTLTLAFLCSNAHSQEKKHELSVGAGFLGDVQILALAGDVIGTMFTLGYGMELGDKYSFITPHINYRYNFVKWFSLGATLNFDQNNVYIARDMDDSGSINNDEWKNKIEYNRYYYTVAIEGIFNYLNKSNIRLYGLIGAGGTLANIPGFKDLRNTVLPNFQINPFGISVGDNVAGYFELGYGYKGINECGHRLPFLTNIIAKNTKSIFHL